MTNNTSKDEKEKIGTISIRNMSLELWYEFGYQAKKQGKTMTQYTMELIKKELKNKEKASE